MILFAKRWTGNGFVGVFVVAVVQYTITTCVDGDVLEVFWSYCSEVQNGQQHLISPGPQHWCSAGLLPVHTRLYSHTQL